MDDLMTKGLAEFTITDHAIEKVRERCGLGSTIDDNAARAMMAKACADKGNWKESEERGDETQFYVFMEKNILNGMHSNAYFVCKGDTSYGRKFAVVTAYSQHMYDQRKKTDSTKNVFLQKEGEMRKAQEAVTAMTTLPPGSFALVMPDNEIVVGEKSLIEQRLVEALTRGVPIGTLRVWENKPLRLRLEV